MAGRGLPRRGQGRRLGEEDPGLERGSRRAPTQARPRRGADELGEGMGQGGRDGGLAQTVASQRLPGAASAVGGGADTFLDRPTEDDEQRLRAALCERRSARVCCHDPPHGEAARPSLRVFHTASEGEFSEVRPRSCAFAQEGGIGVARLNESRSSENKMVAECEYCALLSTIAGQSSIASSIAAVFTTRCRASTSSVNLCCCSRAVSRSTCMAQLKQAHTLRPFSPSSSRSCASSSRRPPPRGSVSGLIRKRLSRSKRPTSSPFFSNSARSSSAGASSPP